MIDVSTMAPVSGIAGAAGTPGAATTQGGAAGFLRLFEIVLGGMPGVAAGAVSPELAGGVAVNPGDALASPTVTATSLQGIETLLGSGEASAEPAIPMVDAARIAELLGLLGFQVQPADIQALGGMDRFQLDQAMEFLERGVVAGVSPDALLENAGYLMPGEWDLQGANSAAPRTTELAPAAFTPEGIDPAAILAAAEAIRSLLNPTLVQGEMASLRIDAPASEAAAATPSAQIAPPTTAPQALPGLREISAAIEADPDLAVAVASQVQGETETEPDTAIAKPETAKIGDIDPAPVHPRPAPSPRSGLTEIVQRSQPETFAAKVASAAEGIVVSPRGGSKETTPAATSVANAPQMESGALAPSNAVFEAPRSLEDTSATRGIKPGSMASEFIGRQVLEKVDVQLRQGRRELSVRLWPEELGEVRLSLRVGEADRLDARILVQTESVRQAILDATPQLREALSRHGMEMGRLSVNVDSGAADSRGGSGTAGQDRSRDGQQRPREQAAWREESVAYASTLALGIDSGIRDGRNTLDMWS